MLRTIVSLGAVLVFAHQATAQVANLFPVDDAYVQGGSQKSTQLGKSLEVAVNNSSDPDVTRYAFFKFDLNDLKSEDVAKAVFAVRIKEQHIETLPKPLDVAAIDLSLVRDDSWDEETISWKTMPSADESVAASLYSCGTHHCLEAAFDITGLVESEKAGDGVLSFRLKGALSGDRHVAMWSKDVNDPAVWPRLTVWGSEDAASKVRSDGESADLTLLPTDDVYVHVDNPDTKYGNILELAVNGTQDDQQRETYLKFDLTEAQHLAFSNVVLALRVKEQHKGPITQPLDRMRMHISALTDDTWSEKSVTWDNRPTAGTPVRTFESAETNHCDVLQFDLTDIVSQSISEDRVLSLRIHGELQGQHMAFWSKDVNHPAVRPELRFYK